MYLGEDYVLTVERNGLDAGYTSLKIHDLETYDNSSLIEDYSLRATFSL